MVAARNSQVTLRYAQAAADFVATDDFPTEFLCPITQTLMQDPVLTVQGNVYERTAITAWLQIHATDPVTNIHLNACMLIPCNPIKSEIEAFRAAVQQLGPEAAAGLPELPPKQSGIKSQPKPVDSQNLDRDLLPTPVDLVPFPFKLTTRMMARSAVLYSNNQVASYQSIIGTYLQTKQQSALKQVSKRPSEQFEFSQQDIRLFHHLMDKLETLSTSVAASQPLTPSWTQAITPFKQQLYRALCTTNHDVQAFASRLSRDNFAPNIGPQLQAHAHDASCRPHIFDLNKPLLSQVHTVLLIDDSGSMEELSHATWDGAEPSPWGQVRHLLNEVTPLMTQYDPERMDIHFLNHSDLQQGLQSNADVHAVISGTGGLIPGGATSLALHSSTIVDAYTASLRYCPGLKPLNLVVITDGRTDNEQMLVRTLQQHTKHVRAQGHPAHQLGVHLLQVGSCSIAASHMRHIGGQAGCHSKVLGCEMIGPIPLSMQHTKNGALTLMQAIEEGIYI